MKRTSGKRVGLAAEIRERGAALILLLVAALIILLLSVRQGPAQAQGSAHIDEELRRAVEVHGEVPVVITLDVPQHQDLNMAAPLQEGDLQALTHAITRAGDGVLQRMAGQQVSQVKRYDYFPFLAMIVDETALQALAADPTVQAISLDVPLPPAMDDTIPLINAHNNHFLNYKGTGWSVAILDTGVDKFHSALFGKTISEACYSSNVPAHGASSLCPGGATSSTATNSALNCATGITGCDHGTHVAGIAARVAPGAWLIPIQVFSRFTDGGGNTFCISSNRTSPCTLSYTSDQIAALNRVWSLHIVNNGINVAAANMSLGSGFHTGPCDHLSEYNNLRIAIQQLRDQNVATVIAAGNSGYRNAMAAPACLTPAISVAASDKSNVVASYSNLSVFTTLIAPGTSILAPVPSNLSPNVQALSGTSMAAPHVAGAIATFKEAQPNATVPQVINALTTSGPIITDQRSGGSVSKRRLDAWSALCTLINCDINDFRTISANQTLGGAISPANDVDIYYYFGTAGQRLTLRLDRTSGSHDPYLELFSPGGFRVAFNDNGGGGVNALINGYLLPQNGLYQIRARSANTFTGNYQISASTQAETLNPVPQISHLSPTGASGTFFGSDFWVAIYGSNFMPESQVRWNGQLRAKFYSSSSLIYIRVLGGDIGWPWPRSAFVTVTNPTPGGGVSNSRIFSVRDPFLGESSWVAPDTGSSVSAGISQTFTISWTAPVTTTTWRDMQTMDMRLRNEAGEIAAWVRVVEQPGDDSYFRLLNASEETVGEGLPGENVTLVLTDTVSLHLADSSFSGSGLTAIMTPTLTFGPAAVGTYNVEFRVDTQGGDDDEPKVQEDVLGTFTVLPAGCDVALDGITIAGDSEGQVGIVYPFSTTTSPTDATAPITYTWTPEPDSGQGFPNAAYTFDHAGEYAIGMQAENCGAFAAGVHTMRIATGTNPDLAISKHAPATAPAGETFTYTLTITNSGALTATNLLIQDVLPSGATYVGGGTMVGNNVQWSLPELAGYGGTTQVTYRVSATADVANSDYSVAANGGYGAVGSETVMTRIVDAQVSVTPVISATLDYGSAPENTAFYIPAGSLFADTIITYEELSSPGYTLPVGARFAGRAFRVDAYRQNRHVPYLQLGEPTTVIVGYSQSDVSGLNENLLQLLFWDGNSWQDNGVDCSTDTVSNRLTCNIEQAMLTQYVLAEVVSRLYLPIIMHTYGPHSAQITSISSGSGQYQVAFETVGFQPQLPGQHVHFFFNTVPPDQAGVPGAGPWYVYGGPSPFTGYGPTDRPAAATQMCVLVANPDHTVRPGTGNCYSLP